MRWVASLGGVGYLRPAPGTWGSLISVFLAYAVLSVAGPWIFLVMIFLLFFMGLKATSDVTDTENHDPSWVVIDELVGQWIALLPVAFGALRAGTDLLDLYPGWIAGFVLFRLFDIWKPSIIGRADRRGDAMGVMLDDVWAGVFAASGVILLAAIYHVPLILAAP